MAGRAGGQDVSMRSEMWPVPCRWDPRGAWGGGWGGVYRRCPEAQLWREHRLGVKPGFRLCLDPRHYLCGSRLTSLSLGFLICEMGAMRVIWGGCSVNHSGLKERRGGAGGRTVE